MPAAVALAIESKANTDLWTIEKCRIYISWKNVRKSVLISFVNEKRIQDARRNNNNRERLWNAKPGR